MPPITTLARGLLLPPSRFNPDNFWHAEPPPSALHTFAKSTGGKLLGSNTGKVAAGICIGVGVTGLIVATGGIALGAVLVVIGIAAWIASTTVSTAAMSDKSVYEKVLHIGLSLMLGTAGIFGGALTVCGAAVPLAAVVPGLVHFGEGFQWFAVLAPLLDFGKAVNPEKPEASVSDRWEDPRHRELREEAERSTDAIRSTLQWLAVARFMAEPEDYFGTDPFDDIDVNTPSTGNPTRLNPELAIPPNTPEIITPLNDRLKALFNVENSEAIRHQTSSHRNVCLTMPDGEDPYLCEPISESDKEWIAVMRQETPPFYDVMLLSSYEKLMTNDAGHRVTIGRHPHSRMPISDDRTIRGLDLITLLDTPMINPAPATEPVLVAPPLLSTSIRLNEIQAQTTIPQ